MKSYFWKCDKDAEEGLGIVAQNHKEAKKIGYEWWGAEVGHDDPDSFINQRCELQRGIDTKGLKKGIVDTLEGVKRGIYSWADDTCPVCKEEGHITYDEDRSQVHCGCLDAE